MTSAETPELVALDAEDRVLVRLTAAIQLGDFTLVRALRRAQPVTTTATTWRRWREAVLQLHLFAGIPRVVEAFDALADAGGPGALDDDEREREPDRFEAGRALFARIYGERAAPVRATLEGFHPALAGWIEGHAYGRVLGRPGLDVARREVLAVVALVVLDQPHQLAAHVRGARRVGVGARVFDEVLDELADLLAPDVLARARGVVARYV